MGDNNNPSNVKPLGNRMFLVDPNNFDYQYHLDTDKAYNMTVSPEDLSILVELKTQTKSRTILNTEKSESKSFNYNGRTVSFMDGSKNKTTGGENYLTTNYTNLSTTFDEVDETLGITSIDIDFSSSYAPTVNINFIDVKGGSIFQPAGNSKYDVFFRLPYPLFELTVKGFYGKPVTYCLHLTKCNTRFNSQTGNFEIAANFIGYTYAMLSDMTINLLKAAVMTNDGKTKLAARNVISINEFIRRAGKIDDEIEKLINSSNDQTVINLGNINEIKNYLAQIEDLTTSTIESMKNDTTISVYQQENEKYIVVIAPLQFDSNGIELDYNFFREKIPAYQKELYVLINNCNEKVGDYTYLKFNNKDVYQTIWTTSGSCGTDAVSNEFKLHIKEKYKYSEKTDDTTVLDGIITKLKSAAQGVPVTTDGQIKWYDFSIIIDEVNRLKTILTEEEKKSSEQLAEKLKEKLVSVFGFNPTIKNIVNLLTNHVEVFLELIFEKSSKYNDTNRVKEFEKFKSQTDNYLDIDKERLKDIIYPWPEYVENNTEKYKVKKENDAQ